MAGAGKDPVQKVKDAFSNHPPHPVTGHVQNIVTFKATGVNCNWFTGVCEIPGAPPFQRLKAMDLDSVGRLHVLDSFGAAVIMLDPADGAYLGMYGQYGEEPGTLRVPMDVLAADSGDSVVTSGDGARIELFANP